jgi:hypothetical protein
VWICKWKRGKCGKDWQDLYPALKDGATIVTSPLKRAGKKLNHRWTQMTQISQIKYADRRIPG